jgi:hypothetical protein
MYDGQRQESFSVNDQVGDSDTDLYPDANISVCRITLLLSILL